MLTLPPESRASLGNLSSLVLGLCPGTSQEAAARKLFGRQAHWLKFVLRYGLPDAVLSTLNDRDRNFVLALYAADLANNNTILCRAIKSNTIKGYLHAAASFSTAAQRLDLKLYIYGRRSIYVSKILAEVKCWEFMPSRREPVSDNMLDYMI